MSNIITAGNATNNGTSISSDTSGVLELKTGSTPTTAIAVDASQNVGIGTTSPASGYKVSVNGTGNFYAGAAGLGRIFLGDPADSNGYIGLFRSTIGPANYNTGGNALNFAAIDGYSFSTGGAVYGSQTERMRIDSSGNLLVGTTSTFDNVSFLRVQILGGASTKIAGTGATSQMSFFNDNGRVGFIGSSGTTTSYSTSSDYRLKEAIAPMTGALAKVVALKPVTYKWKVDGSDGQGFIAHELQEVVPQCVTGEKDAVDAEGKPQYQGIDTSFLVATLTAAIQELKAELDATKAEVAALKGA